MIVGGGRVVSGPGDRRTIVAAGWGLVAVGFVFGVVLAWYARTSPFPRSVGLTNSHFYIFVGIVLTVVGIALTLYVEPLKRWQVRLYFYFGGVGLVAIGAGAISFTRFSPYDEGLAIVGTMLIIAGVGLSMYNGSFWQWLRRVWLIGLGILVLAVGAAVYGTIGLFAAMGAEFDSGILVVMLSAVALSLAAAVVAFVKAWRTPERHSKQPRWHQIGR
jgi:hypothetical protein